MAATELKDVRDQAGKIGDKVVDHARDAGQDLSGEFKALKTQVEDLAATVATQAKATVNAATETAGAAARRVARKAEAGYEHAVDQAADYYSEAERFTVERPATALGLAVGAGILAGLLLARR